MEILDKATLAAVIAASPDIPGEKDDARELCKKLYEWGPTSEQGSMLVQDIADGMNTPISNIQWTASHIGRILRLMGLSGKKTRFGYRYYWTNKQLEILTTALK